MVGHRSVTLRSVKGRILVIYSSRGEKSNTRTAAPRDKITAGCKCKGGFCTASGGGGQLGFLGSLGSLGMGSFEYSAKSDPRMLFLAVWQLWLWGTGVFASGSGEYDFNEASGWGGAQKVVPKRKLSHFSHDSTIESRQHYEILYSTFLTIEMLGLESAGTAIYLGPFCL